jgi:hypothetical protein
VIVHHEVIDTTFVPVKPQQCFIFVARCLKASLQLGLIHGPTPLQSTLERRKRRGYDEDSYRVVGKLPLKIERSPNIDLKKQILATRDTLYDTGLQGAIEVAMSLLPLKELTLFAP